MAANRSCACWGIALQCLVACKEPGAHSACWAVRCFAALLVPREQRAPGSGVQERGHEQEMLGVLAQSAASARRLLEEEHTQGQPVDLQEDDDDRDERDDAEESWLGGSAEASAQARYAPKSAGALDFEEGEALVRKLIGR